MLLRSHNSTWLDLMGLEPNCSGVNCVGSALEELKTLTIEP